MMGGAGRWWVWGGSVGPNAVPAVPVSRGPHPDILQKYCFVLIGVRFRRFVVAELGALSKSGGAVVSKLGAAGAEERA